MSLLLVGLLAYLVVVPILLLVVGGFKPEGLVTNPGFTLTNYIELYSVGRTYTLVLDTVIFAAGSTAVCMILATALAWLVERTDVPWKAFWRIAVIAPMAVPPMLIAMSWVLLGSPRIGFFNVLLRNVFHLQSAPINIYTFPGMMFVQGITMVPGTFMLLGFPFRNMDPVFEDASAVAGRSTFTTLRRIVLPILRPALLAATILTFMVSMAVFDIPGIIGLPAKIKVLSLHIYLAAMEPDGASDFGSISALSTIFLIAILMLTFVYVRQMRAAGKFATITGREFKPRIMELGKWRYVVLLFFGLYVVVATGFPLAILFWSSLMPYYGPVSLQRLRVASFANYRTIIEYPRLSLAMQNSFIVALVAATAVVLLATVISWIVVRSRCPGRKALDLLSVLPMSLPHIMLGLALMYVYLNIKVGIYGTIWIIVLAYVTAYLTYGTRLLNSTMVQIHKELEEAAQVSGASNGRILRTIIVPLLAPGMVGLWIWVFVFSIRELSAALMLQSYKSLILSTLLWHIWERGEIPQAATLGVMAVVFLFVLMAAGHLLSRRFELFTGKAR